MSALRVAVAKVRAWWRRDAVAGEIREEMQFHLQMREDEYRRNGLALAEARRAASERFGNVALMADRGYDIRSGGLMDTVIQDVRYAVRIFGRQPGFSFVAILTVALAIGLSTALFSVIDAAVLRPLPYPHPEQLVRVRPEGPPASMADLRLWQSAEHIFSAVAASGTSFGGRIVDDVEPERIQVLQFTEDYLPMYGVVPLIGRNFTRDEMDAGAPPVALLGYGYWQSRYSGRTDIVGETIRLDDGVATIVGVLPRSFNATTAVSRPLQIPSRGTGRVSVYARLQPDVSIEQARERLAALMGGTVMVASELEATVAGYTTTVHVLSGALALIVLIACVNVGGLMLARGATRQSELAVRASLGAGRFRLVRQLLTESLVLAVVGGTSGVLLAWLSLDVIVANVPMTLPTNAPAVINLPVLGATTVLLLLTALLCGLVPALRLSRVRIGSALARGARQPGWSLSRRGSQWLIATEVALAVVLVAGAGLMVRSFARLSTTDLGLSRDGLVTMEVLSLDQNAGMRNTYYAALLRQVRAIPGVASVGLVDNFALGDRTTYTSFNAAGATVFSRTFATLPGYFETIGARLKDGRLPTDADITAGLRPAVLNEAAARALFPNGPAIGRQFTRAKPPDEWTVLGVVDDIRHSGPLDSRGPSFPQVFLPLDSGLSMLSLPLSMVVAVRPSSPIPDLPERLRRTAQTIGPRVLVERVRTADDWFGSLVITPRRRTVLLGLLGGLGLMLVLVGVFGMTAYAVARRTSEVGVRMALGARPGDVVRQLVGEAVRPLLCGLAIGLVGAYYATRVIESFLFETTPHDPVTFAAVAVLIAVSAVLAAWIPARRAARVDPVSALRAE